MCFDVCFLPKVQSEMVLPLGDLPCFMTYFLLCFKHIEYSFEYVFSVCVCVHTRVWERERERGGTRDYWHIYSLKSVSMVQHNTIQIYSEIIIQTVFIELDADALKQWK